MATERLEIIMALKGGSRVQSGLRGTQVGVRGIQSAAVAGRYALMAMAAAYAMVIKFAKDSIRVGGEYEATIARLGAISGASAKEVGALDEAARHLGETTQYTARQAAMGMQQLVSANVRGEEAINASIRAMIALSTVYGPDLTDTARLMAQAISIFGVDAQYAAKQGQTMDQVMMQMAAHTGAALRNSIETGLQPFIDAFGPAAAATAKFNWSIKDTLVGLSAFNLAGELNAKMGYTFARMLNRLAKLASKTGRGTKTYSKLLEDAAKSVGLSLDDLDPSKIKDFPTLMGNLAKVLGDMHPGKIEAIMEGVAGRVLPLLIKKMKEGKVSVKQLNKAFDESSGAKLMEEYGKIMGSPFMQFIVNVTSKLEALKIAFYDIASPYLISAYQEFGTAVKLMMDYWKTTEGTKGIQEFVESVKDLALLLLRIIPPITKFVATYPKLTLMAVAFSALRLPTALIGGVGQLASLLTGAAASAGKLGAAGGLVAGVSPELAALIKGGLVVGVAISGYKLGQEMYRGFIESREAKGATAAGTARATEAQALEFSKLSTAGKMGQRVEDFMGDVANGMVGGIKMVTGALGVVGTLGQMEGPKALFRRGQADIYAGMVEEATRSMRRENVGIREHGVATPWERKFGFAGGKAARALEGALPKEQAVVEKSMKDRADLAETLKGMGISTKRAEDDARIRAKVEQEMAEEKAMREAISELIGALGQNTRAVVSAVAGIGSGSAIVGTTQ